MRSLAVIAALFLASLLAGCGLLPEQKDETIGWSANKLFAEAKSASSEGLYDKAIKYYEKLESRYPYGRFAQQAQMEIAYAYWKSYADRGLSALLQILLIVYPIDFVFCN